MGTGFKTDVDSETAIIYTERLDVYYILHPIDLVFYWSDDSIFYRIRVISCDIKYWWSDL